MRFVRELGESRGSEAMPAGAMESLPLLSSVLSVVDAGEFEARVLEHQSSRSRVMDIHAKSCVLYRINGTAPEFHCF